MVGAETVGVALAETAGEACHYRFVRQRGFVAIRCHRLSLGHHGAGVERHHRTQGGQLVEVEELEEPVGGKKHNRVGVVYDVLRVGGAEIVQHGHYHGTVCHSCHKRYHPVGGVASEQSYFVALPYSGQFEEQVEAGYAASHVAVAYRLACHIVGERGQRKVIGERCAVYLQQVVVRGLVVWFFESIVHFLSLWGSREARISPKMASTVPLPFMA